jgi:hypothetical protein
MPVVKRKPTSPGSRFVVKVVNPALHKGKPHAPLLATKSKNGGRNNQGRITTRHQGGGHKQRYRIIDFKRNKDNVPARVERLEYDPNRSANIALLLYSDGERRYVCADQAGQLPAAAQHSGRHHGALHRAAPGQGRADGAFGRRLGPAGRSRGHLRHAALALRRDAQGALRVQGDHR